MLLGEYASEILLFFSFLSLNWDREELLEMVQDWWSGSPDSV
jgi:hypothetical protein